MTWALEWHHVAINDLRALPMRAATAIDAEVIRFAATGLGDVEQVSPTDPRRLRLRVASAQALLFADFSTYTLHVARVFRRR